MITLAFDWYMFFEIGFYVLCAVIFLSAVFMKQIVRFFENKKIKKNAIVLGTSNRAAGLVSIVSTEEIKDSTDVAIFLASLTNGIFKAKKDGKLTIADIPYFFTAIYALFPAIVGIKNVIKEFKEYSDDEKKLLIEVFKDELMFDAANCEVVIENLFESCLNMLVNIDRLVVCK